MGRSPNGMEAALTVKMEDNGILQTVIVKEERYDIKMENGAVSVTANVEPSSVDLPKTKRTRQLFSHLPSAKDEALSQFTEIKESIYQYEELGESQQQDVMACECKPLKSEDGTNLACGDNDCINFATSMECTDDECSCGAACRNQRFQRCEYAPIDIIQTDKKGYGIRANSAIPAHTFIYEYVGEVIDEEAFRSRIHEYDEEGIVHFYFMMIQQGEYIDATKRGGLGRFLNHSCAPNCYVDKWVVGTKLRMGIFADRNIQAGEELTFDYNVDRYGAEAQPCYCGEPNCIGYIGGKTQSEAQPKLSHAIKEALGFDSDQDWATATSRKRRRAKKDDDDTDEDYVVSSQAKPVTEDGVARIMSSLLQARERWVIIKLLGRLQQGDETGIWHRVLKMHGYQILGAVLKEWRIESNIVTTVLHILLKLPRVTKNKIDSSGIEVTVKELSESDNTRVKDLASNLLQEWDALEMGFRISRRPKSANKSASPSKDSTISDSKTSSIKTSTPATTTATTTTSKQITNVLHRPTKVWTPSPRVVSYTDNDAFRNVPRGPAAITHTPTPHSSLPAGWSSAVDPSSGKTYYYRRGDNKTQWDPPTTDENVAAAAATTTTTTSSLPKGELQRFIEEANRQIAEREAEKKAEEERKRLEREKEEVEAAEAKAKERAERKLHRQQHHHHHSQQQQHSHRHTETKGESSSNTGKSKLEKQISVQFGKYVPNVIAGRYLTLTRDEVKRHARDIVHILVSKEIKAGKHHISEDLSDDKKRKIKVFVKDYMGKVMARKTLKDAAKQQQQQQQQEGENDAVQGISETGTPHVPGSTPREKGEGGLDTPVSGSVDKTPAGEEEVDMEIDDDDNGGGGAGAGALGNGMEEANGVFVSPVGFGTDA